MVKRVEVILGGLSLLVIGWGILSWIDVILHNTSPNPVYQWWNLFILIF